MDFKQHIAGLLSEKAGLDEGTVWGLFETPPDAAMGDLAFPCFTLAKTLKKAPVQIAKDLAAQIGADEFLEKAEAAGPYVNFFYHRANFMKNTISQVQEQGTDFGASDMGAGKTVIVEFSSPNIAKPFHIGHLFSTAVGNSLNKIYQKLGYKTIAINHLGDWGTQFGKLICAYEKWGDRSAIEADPINELMKIYVKFHEEAEKDPSLDDEARHCFKLLEDGDPHMHELWQYFRDESLKEFMRVYDQLGVHFDSFNGEAFYSDKMDAVVADLKAKNLLTESENAQVVMLEEENLLPCMILKSDGSTIYATRDLAAAIYRKNTYDFDKNIYVVGLPQTLHFKQIFATLAKMGYEWAQDCRHVGFGTVKFPDRKMSTRSGDVVALEEVLSGAIEKTKAIMQQNPNIENLDETAKKVGTGAIFYSFLKNSRERDIIFSWDDMLDFEGESGPYVQYSYARGKSVLRKAEGISFDGADFSCATGEEEYQLVKLMASFSDVVVSAAAANEPFHINRFVTNLARLFNKFYNAAPILKADEATKKARLAITSACCTCIQAALALLGIDVVEKM